VNLRSFLFIPGVILLLGLACNFPVGRATQQPGDAIQQTLMVTLFPTPISEATLPQIEPTREETESPPYFPKTGLHTLSPEEVMTVTPVEEQFFRYLTQTGDTIEALAGRFGVSPEQIQSAKGWLSPESLLPAGQELIIPNQIGLVENSWALIPDSEVIDSPSTVNFNIFTYVQEANGFLASYQEEIDQEPYSGAQVIEQVAIENSINPRLLLAILEFQSHWVYGQPSDAKHMDYPIGFQVPEYRGLYKELSLTVRQLTTGYYGWRSGKLTTLQFINHQQIRLAPELNAGSIALQMLFSQLYNQQEWKKVLYDPGDFLHTYQSMFGDPWKRAAQVEPLYPETLQQPALELPFAPGTTWSLTGGPHNAWGVGSAQGGLDFAPTSSQSGCYISPAWATASAAGLVVRSDHGVLVIDLDGDGHEQTGWNLVYLHLASLDRASVGTWVNKDDRLGHPSCEGGVTTGLHVHISRKYNGEWITAGPPLPFVLSGWLAHPGIYPYLGTLTKGDQVVTAKSDGSHTSLISR